MKKIISSIIFIFSVALLSIFITILVSENSTIVSYLYKDKIVKEVEDKISLNVNFNDLRVKWEGLNPQLWVKSFPLYSEIVKIYIQRNFIFYFFYNFIFIQITNNSGIF